jgi:hypothetical protein
MRPESTRLALDRAARRRGEEGAAMFIVALTTAVLASVGVFALAAAATEVRASGNERQATQTHFLSQYAMIAGAMDLSSSGKPSMYRDLMLGTIASTKNDGQCWSLPGLNYSSSVDNLQKACKRLDDKKDLVPQWTGTNTGKPLIGYTGSAPNQGTPGSLGPIPMIGEFWYELTDPAQTDPPAGYGLGSNICFYGYTISAYGRTRPDYGTNAAGSYAGAGIEVQRARVIAGPDRR